MLLVLKAYFFFLPLIQPTYYIKFLRLREFTYTKKKGGLGPQQKNWPFGFRISVDQSYASPLYKPPPQIYAILDVTI